MKNQPIQYNQRREDVQSLSLQDPEVFYGADLYFSIKDLDKLNETLGFSQAEWSEILHMSPRTLQRYQNDGTSFEGLQAELLYQLERLIDLGITQFNTRQSFVQWLRSPKEVLGHLLDFNALKSITGVRLLRDELGRMAEGVYI